MGNGLALYAPFIKEIKDLIYRRQYEAMKKVNTELIQLYWEIGGEIERQQWEHGRKKSVVEILAKELQKEFPGTKGFTARNLWFMRQFYTEYSSGSFMKPLASEIEKMDNFANVKPMVAEMRKKENSANVKPVVADLEIPLQDTNLPPLVAEISWTKNLVIMQKCKAPIEREFYIKMTRRYGWTKNVLINNIENRAFEKYLTNQTNFDDTVPEKYKLQAKLAVKDDYNFDFLEMGIEHSEAELEAAIINNVRAFLIEMGGDFCFIGNQFHLDVTDEDYHIDLLLFHRRLRSLVAIDLKIGEFMPEFVGKMQFYLTALDETKKLPDENPSIGIIICKTKHRTRVEYTLKTANTPIGVATYSLHDRLPENLRSLLPSPDEIAKIIHNFEGEDDEIV